MQTSDMATAQDALKALGKDMLTKTDMIRQFRGVLPNPEFKALIEEGKVSCWPDSISGNIIYYRQGYLSESKFAQYLQDNIQKLDFGEMVLGFLPFSDNYGDLLDFLSSFDLKKNGKPWINELFLTQAMDILLRNGSLDDKLTSAEIAAIKTSKIGPVTEEQMVALGACTPVKDDSGEVKWKIRPVDWHLLVKTGENPPTYQSAYCMKLANELQNLGLSFAELSNSENIADDNKKNNLLRLGLINEDKKLNELGKQQVEFMSKCTFDFRDKHLLENLYAISEHWRDKAAAELSDITVCEDDMIIIRKIDSIKYLKVREKRIQEAKESGKDYFEIKKRRALAAKPFAESSLRAFSAKFDFYNAYSDMGHEAGIFKKLLYGEEITIDDTLKNFTLKYWNLKESDLISFDEFKKREGIVGLHSIKAEEDAKQEYAKHIFEIIKNHKKVDDSLYSGILDIFSLGKGIPALMPSLQELPCKLFKLIEANEESERDALKGKIGDNLEYVIAMQPTREEFYYFKNLLGKSMNYFKTDMSGAKYTRLVGYARCNNLRVTVEHKSTIIDRLSSMQFARLVKEVSAEASCPLEWDLPADKIRKYNSASALNDQLLK